MDEGLLWVWGCCRSGAIVGVGCCDGEHAVTVECHNNKRQTLGENTGAVGILQGWGCMGRGVTGWTFIPCQEFCRGGML